MFYRVSNAVISPSLIKDLSLNAETLGILGGAFFYSFALFQIPMGLLLDRIGPRIIITVFALTGALGAFIFAFSDGLPLAIAGRILIGVGMASVLMGSLKVFVLRFDPEKFATLSGIIISVGTIGNILATSPLAYLNGLIGWRHTFILAGLITILLSICVFIILKKGDGKDVSSADIQLSPVHDSSHFSIRQAFVLVLKNLSFWQIGSLAFFRYGTFVALQGLWLGPYLINIKGYSPIETGNILMMLSFGMILGAPAGGFLADRIFKSVRKLVLCSIGVYTLCLMPLCGMFNLQSPAVYSAIFFAIGFFSGFGTLTYAHIKRLYPLNMSGTVIAGVNFFTMAGGAVFMQAMGYIIESFIVIEGGRRTYPPEAYHIAFLICFLGMALSLVFYSFSEDRPSS